jgi:hypothetical protein
METHIPVSVMILFVLAPIIAIAFYIAQLRIKDLNGAMRARLIAAFGKYKDTAIDILPSARLPASTAEPGVLVVFSDRILFEPFGGKPMLFAMKDIRTSSFRSVTTEDLGLTNEMRVLRIELPNDYWEFAVLTSHERRVQSALDSAQVKRAEPVNLPPSQEAPQPPTA